MWVVDEGGHIIVCSESLKKCEKYVKNEIKSIGKFILRKEYLYDAEGHIKCITYENSTKDEWFCIWNIKRIKG